MVLTQYFDLDIVKPSLNRLRLVNGDTANTFVITIKENGAGVTLDATLHKIIAVFRRADGEVYTQDATTGLSFTTGGIVTIDLRPASFRTGTNKITLQIYKRENSSATEYPLLLTTQEQTFNARAQAIPDSGAPNAPSQLPMLEQYVLAAKSYANGNTGTREGENTDNAKYYADVARSLFEGTVVEPSILDWMDDHPDETADVIGDWLDDHPEATTTVEDGAITNAKLASDLKTIIGIESTTGELFETTDWVVGYLGSTKVMNATSNGDMRTSKAAAVHAGDTITVTIAIPLSEQYAYLYYAYVTGVNDLTYVSQRYGGSSKYNSADSSYRYYSLTIDVIADGYIVFSYRPHGEQISASHFLGSSTTNNIEKLDIRLDDAEDDISGNSTAIAANAEAITAINTEADYYRFPSDDSLPICVCHRGLATEGLPENTLTAYRDAKDKGWKWVETDIRMTSDGVWVCLHDASINRTARNADGTAISGTVNIADITYEQALTYDFGIYAGSQYAGTKILTLDDFLNYCNKAHLYAQLEIKNSLWTKAQLLTAWNIVLKYRMGRKVMLLCSSIGSIDDLLEDYPYVPVTMTRPGAWTPIAQADWETTVPYPNGVKSGKNKVYWEQIRTGFSNKADMQNFVDYCHYWGVNAGVYCPTTVSAMGDLVDTLDIVCSQYVKYDEVKADNTGDE